MLECTSVQLMSMKWVSELGLELDLGSVHVTGKLLVRALEDLERELDSMSVHMTGTRWVRELELGLESDLDSKSMSELELDLMLVHRTGIRWVRESELGSESSLDSESVHPTGIMLVTELELVLES